MQLINTQTPRPVVFLLPFPELRPYLSTFLSHTKYWNSKLLKNAVSVAVEEREDSTGKMRTGCKMSQRSSLVLKLWVNGDG